MASRLKEESLFLRHEFSDAERLEMGRELAQPHNRMAGIEEEEAVMKTQIKERKTGVEATVGSLSRRLNDGYEMSNVLCELIWDEPNVGEVTYKRKDNGEVAKVRAMTVAERQLELPLASEPPKTQDEVDASIAKSAAAADDFFGPSEDEEAPGEEDEPEPEGKNGPAELAKKHARQTGGRKKKEMMH